MYPENEADQHVTFFSLMALSFPQNRDPHLTTPSPSPLLQASLPPDEQLLCFDYLYYVGAFQVSFVFLFCAFKSFLFSSY